jgi:nickel and cobalt resistance protein CnrR
MNANQRQIISLTVWLIIVAAVAAFSCLLTARWMPQCLCQRPAAGHAWLHQKLKLSPDQAKQLEPIEQRYAEEKRHQEEMMNIANRELAQVILEEKRDSEKVRIAVDKIHHAMGEMQKATINHVFAMQPVLNAEQYEHLLQLTAQGLNEISSSEN